MRIKIICCCAFLSIAAMAVQAKAWTQLRCCLQPDHGASHWVVPAIPVWANTNHLPNSVTQGEFLSAVQNALNTWNGAGANILFTYKGVFGSEACSPGGFVDCSDPESPCRPTYVDVVGFTTNLLWDQVLAFYPGLAVPIEPALAQEFDTCLHLSGKTLAYSVALNQQVPFSPNPGETEFDLESAILHELGHVLGLGHSGVEGSVMWPTIAPGVLRRELQPDDIAGIRSMYPPSQGACCVPGSGCIDGLTWAECASQGGTYMGDGSTCAGIQCPTLMQWGTATLVMSIVASAWMFLRRRKAVVG